MILMTVKILRDMIHSYESVWGERPAKILMSKTVFHQFKKEIESSLSTPNEPLREGDFHFAGIPVELQEDVDFIELKR